MNVIHLHNIEVIIEPLKNRQWVGKDREQEAKCFLTLHDEDTKDSILNS